MNENRRKREEEIDYYYIFFLFIIFVLVVRTLRACSTSYITTNLKFKIHQNNNCYFTFRESMSSHSLTFRCPFSIYQNAYEERIDNVFYRHEILNTIVFPDS